MAWDTLKESLLAELEQRIEKRAEASDRQSLHNLSASLYSRLPAEDMHGRSVENLYGCLYGLLRFLRKWPGRCMHEGREGGVEKKKRQVWSRHGTR